MSDHRYGSGELISIDFWCEADGCGHRSWDTIPRTEATYENRWDCPSCSAKGTLKRIPSAARVHTRTFPDGYKRAGFQDLKEASRLQAEVAGIKPEDRAKVTSEIDRLEGRK